MSAKTTKVIHIRVTEEQDRRLRGLAAEAQVSVSDWVRLASLGASIVVANPGVLFATAADRQNLRPIRAEVKRRKSKATREAEKLLGKAALG